MGFENACNVAFAVFMGTWVVTRHFLYNVLWWSIYKNVPDAMPWGCYSGKTSELISTDAYPDSFAYLFAPFRSLENPICMNRTIKWIFLSFLLSIQALSLVWFTMIVRVAYLVVAKGNAEDTRSDDEEDVEISDESASNGNVRLAAKEGAIPAPVVNETAPGLDRRRSNGTASVRARGHGRMPFDQSDRKALLGRIGCEKPT